MYISEEIGVCCDTGWIVSQCFLSTKLTQNWSEVKEDVYGVCVQCDLQQASLFLIGRKTLGNNGPHVTTDPDLPYISLQDFIIVIVVLFFFLLFSQPVAI